MDKKGNLFFGFVAAALLIWLAIDLLQVHFSLESLEVSEKKAGYVKVGTFAEKWPARVTGTELSKNEIKFTLANGTPHAYSGFDGYELKLVRLAAFDGSEHAVVFRSENKE